MMVKGATRSRDTHTPLSLLHYPAATRIEEAAQPPSNSPARGNPATPPNHYIQALDLTKSGHYVQTLSIHVQYYLLIFYRTVCPNTV
ncbi:hypothetical protein FKM82_021375 [Ascaphus truei]